MNTSFNALRLNVGFLIHQSVGFSREFLFDYETIHLSPDLDLGLFSGSVRITRTPQGLLVQGRIAASLVVQCVRCLADITQPLQVDFTELYAFSPRTTSESNLILPEDGHIDLAPLVREFFLLEIPINPICDSNCRGLCPICGENLNDTPHDHGGESFDPRLEVLKRYFEEQ